MTAIRVRAVVTLATAVVVAVARAQDQPATPLGLDIYYPVPAGNPVTGDKIALGRELFFETRLSSDQRISCASCHKPDRAFSDDAPLSVGAEGRKGRRHAPALVNRAYGRAFFWDGRVDALEDQVLRPFLDPSEMNLTLEEVVATLRSIPRYARDFQTVFGEAPSENDAAKALATFVRVQRFGDSAFDRFKAGDRPALTPQAQRGLQLFRGRGNCSACHAGPNFTDEAFHNTGVSFGARDIGRFAVTGIDADLGAFKTPTLREVSRTSPYMHDGSLGSLDDVIAFYDRGGTPNVRLDKEIRPLSLSLAEKADLKAFLLALTSDRQK